jgi:hypothetical protein
MLVIVIFYKETRETLSYHKSPNKSTISRKDIVLTISNLLLMVLIVIACMYFD